ncbi:hypothetical protein BH11ARM2_BH11ARM2_30850 [soil metagenome]
MIRSLLIAALFAGIVGSAAAQNVAYLSASRDSGPWGSQTYKEDFNKVFGEKGWTESTFEKSDDSLFDPGKTNLLVIEGGDWMADQMAEYINKNEDRLAKFVYEGGHLIINAAPNTGGDIAMFGGAVGLHYGWGDGDKREKDGGSFNFTATPNDYSHPIFNGPFGQVKQLDGNYAGHATVWDKTGLFQPLLTGENGGTMLAQAQFGKGTAFIGGLTTPWTEAYWGSSDQWHTFNQNFLAYSAGDKFVPVTNAVPEPTSMAFIGLGALALVRRRKARKS